MPQDFSHSIKLRSTAKREPRRDALAGDALKDEGSSEKIPEEKGGKNSQEKLCYPFHSAFFTKTLRFKNHKGAKNEKDH